MPTILIVEDNPTNMKLSTFVLESADYTVITATDAEIGLTLKRPASVPERRCSDAAGERITAMMNA